MNQMDPIFFTPPSNQPDGRRVLHKGGGGSAPDYEGQRVAARNAQRQAFYDGIGYSNSGAREESYKKMGDDIRGYRKAALDKEYQEAERNLGFNMARSGNSGGSQEVYEKGKLKEAYDRAGTDLESDISRSIASSKGAYENAVSGGVQSINSGADAATQIASALQKASSAMEEALSGAKGVSYGGLFNSIGSTAEQNNIRTAAAQGVQGIPQSDTKTVSAVGAGKGSSAGRTF